MMMRIKVAIAKRQRRSRKGIESVWRNFERKGISMTAIWRSRVMVTPTTINQLFFKGTLKADFCSLRQLKTWMFWMKTIRAII